MTSLQRWTLAAVCAATAVLMLDIAVVNTALSTIAVDLDTGLAATLTKGRKNPSLSLVPHTRLPILKLTSPALPSSVSRLDVPLAPRVGA